MAKLFIKKEQLFLLVGGIIVLTAVMVMIGWVFDIPAFMTVFPGFPNMKFNTALGLAFSGAATMLLFNTGKKPTLYLYCAFAGIVFMIGFLTLPEIFFHFDTGIDQFFFRDLLPPDEMSPYPGRMVGSSALSFCILGAAFIGLRSPVKIVRHLAQYGLHFVTLLAALAMMGYAFHLTAAYKVSHFTSMAVHTSTAFLFLSVTLSFYNPGLGIPGLFTGRGIGNEMARKLFPAVALTALLLGSLRLRMSQYHLVSNEFAIALSVIVLLFVTVFWVWIVAMQLNDLESEKIKTDHANFNLQLDIAAAKKAEAEIAEINKRSLLFVQQAPSAIAMFDTDMHYIAASEQWITDYHLQGKEIIGHSHYEVFPEIGEDWKTIHRDCLKGAVNKCDEACFVRADGSALWITWDVRPWYNAENKIGGLLMYTADISHLKKNEAIIKETSESLADAQRIAHVGSWDWNIITDELKWSEEQYRIFGLEPNSDGKVPELFYELMHPDDRQNVMSAISDALAGQKPYHTEYRVVRSDGSVRIVEARGKVFRDYEGKAIRMIGTSANITERKKLEHNLMISEKEFRSAFQDSASGMVITSRDFKWLKINEAFCKMMGYTESELMQMTFKDISHPDDTEANLRDVKRLINKEIEKYQIEKRYIHKNGSTVWTLLTVSMVYDEKQEPLYFISQIADITEHKRLEHDLMISEREFRSSFEYSAVGMTQLSLEFKWLKVNPAFCKMLGYTESELMRTPLQVITHPDDLGKNLLHLKQLRNKEIEKYQAEKRYFHKNGSMVWGLLTVSLVIDDKEEPRYFIAQIADITERKRIENELKTVNSELNSIFNAETHASIVSTDLNGVITNFSKGAETLLGYKSAEMVGCYTPAIFHDPLEVGARGKELSVQLQKEVSGFEVFVAVPRLRDFESREWTYMCKNGGRTPVQLVVSAIKDETGIIKGFLGIAIDISERKEAEETRRNYAVLQSRNKEMEEFAFIASHDLQEPLRTVSSFADLLAIEYHDQLKGDAEQYLQFISASTRRMSELIKGLLEFSRIGKQKSIEPVDCNEVMQEVVEDLGLIIHESRAVVIVDELPVINAFPAEMKQLFQNLLSNAIKFKKPKEAPRIHISAKPFPGYWQFEVSDNGVGIDAKHYQKIFILFQRLHGREDYPGTGIGLSYCKKIVELHHGRIWVESVPGQGSHFFFTISNQNL